MLGILRYTWYTRGIHCTALTNDRSAKYFVKKCLIRSCWQRILPPKYYYSNLIIHRFTRRNITQLLLSRYRVYRRPKDKKKTNLVQLVLICWSTKFINIISWRERHLRHIHPISYWMFKSSFSSRKMCKTNWNKQLVLIFFYQSLLFLVDIAAGRIRDVAIGTHTIHISDEQ